MKSPSRVTPLDEGAQLVAKQMEASAGTALPRHRASLESALVVTAGQCIVRLPDGDRPLRMGEAFIVPAEVWHQIVADPEFAAVHVMPKEIRFEFSA